MPVIKIGGLVRERRAVEHQIVGRRFECPIDAHQDSLEEPRQAFVLVPGRLFEPRPVTPRQEPRLERKPRRVRRERDEVGVLLDDAPAVGDFLMHDVAEHAPLLGGKMPPRAVDLRADEIGHDRQRNELRVPVVERRAGGRAVVLEDEDAAEAAILLEIEDPLAKRPQHPLDLRLGHRRHRLAVIGRFDDHLVRSNAVHPVEHSLPFAIESSLDLQRREFVRHDPHFPVRRIRRAAVPAVREHFGRRQRLPARTKRAVVAADGRRSLEPEVARTFLALGGDNDPAAGDGIFSQFRQGRR